MKITLLLYTTMIFTTFGFYSYGQQFTLPISNPFGLSTLADPATQFQIRFYDVDQDDDLDAVHFGLTGDTFFISIQHNIGTSVAPNFGAHERIYLPDTEAFTMAFGDIEDIDNDGKPDLIIFGALDSISGYYCTYYQNVSVGASLQFQSTGINGLGLPTIGDGTFFPSIVDMNNDGDQDIFMGGWRTDPVNEETDGAFYYAQHRGDFADVSYGGYFNGAYGIMMPDTFQAAIATTGDLDNDGDADVLSIVAETDEDFSYYFFENSPGSDNRPAFITPVQNPFDLPDSLGIPDLSDVDGDGDLDLFLYQGETGISYFENTACVNTSAQINLSICEGETVIVGGEQFNLPGTYQVTTNNSAGCDSVINLVLDVTAINEDVTVFDVTLTSSEANADSWQWIDCDSGEDIVGATNIEFTPTSTGNYAVRITKDNCTELSSCTFVSISAVHDLADLGVTLYPIPANTHVQISGIEKYGLDNVLISDGTGQVVKLTLQDGDKIDLGEFSSGMYWVYMDIKGETYTASFLIQR